VKGLSLTSTENNKAGKIIPNIAPKGIARAVMVVDLASSVFENQTIASLEGTEIMNPCPKPPMPWVIIYINREGKAIRSQYEISNIEAAI